MTALRRIPEYTNAMQKNGWAPSGFYTQSIIGKTIGIIGLGATSRYLIEMLKPFNVHIKLFSRHLPETEAQCMGVEKAELEDIFSHRPHSGRRCALRFNTDRHFLFRHAYGI